MTRTALDLFGTAEPILARRRLRAGPLSVLLEAGQLRDLRWHGVEAVRGIAYLLRDVAWGTVSFALSEPEVTEGEGAFAVTYAGRAEGASGRVTLRAAIRGEAGSGEGRLVVEATAAAVTDLLANRLGFVLPHPDHVAGHSLRVVHSDGSTEVTAFPLRISPDQPAFDIGRSSTSRRRGSRRASRWRAGSGEDQRNWADASFKTYVRPLAWPRPYRVPAGTTDRQRVELRLSGRPRERTGCRGEAGAARRPGAARPPAPGRAPPRPRGAARPGPPPRPHPAGARRRA